MGERKNEIANEIFDKPSFGKSNKYSMIKQYYVRGALTNVSKNIYN